jgi:hypothetical protein
MPVALKVNRFSSSKIPPSSDTIIEQEASSPPSQPEPKAFLEDFYNPASMTSSQPLPTLDDFLTDTVLR